MKSSLPGEAKCTQGGKVGSRGGFTQKEMELAAVSSRALERELALGFLCSFASAKFSKIQYFTAGG